MDLEQAKVRGALGKALSSHRQKEAKEGEVTGSGTEGDANPRKNTKKSVKLVVSTSGSNGTQGNGNANLPAKNIKKSVNLQSISSSNEAEVGHDDKAGGMSNDELLRNNPKEPFDPLNDGALNEDALKELDDDDD